MPVHRVDQGERPAQTLADAVVQFEKQGEQVVQFQDWANEWIILTIRKPSPDPAGFKERVA